MKIKFISTNPRKQILVQRFFLNHKTIYSDYGPQKQKKTLRISYPLRNSLNIINAIILASL